MFNYLVPIFLFSAFSTVGKVKVTGSEFFSERQIKKIVGIESKIPFNKFFIQNRETELMYLYKSYGYFDISIKNTYEKENGKNSVDVKINVQEGERYKVKNLEFIPPMPAGKWKYHAEKLKGKNFDTKNFQNIEKQIIEFYADSGYPFVESWDSTTVDTTGKQASVFIFVKKGDFYWFGNVLIKNTHKVRKGLIEKCITIKRGDVFCRTELLATMRNIYALGLFEHVKYKLVPIKAETIDVVIDVSEAPQRILSVFAGYHVPYEFNGDLKLGHLNVFGNAQSITLNYEFLRKIKFPVRRKFEIFYTEPFFIGSHIGIRLHPFYQRDWEEKKENFGADFALRRRFGNFTSVSLAVLWKKVTIGVQEHGLVNSIIFQFAKDRRNNIFFPTSGYRLGLQTEEAGGILSGTENFRRLNLYFSNYKYISDYIFCSRIQVLYERPFGTSPFVPVDEKFRIGGDGTVRGLPRDYMLVDRGLLINIELRKRFTSYWGGKLFVDQFILMESPYDSYTTPGIGTEIYTPIGPVRVDYGFHYPMWKNGYFYIGIGEMF